MVQSDAKYKDNTTLFITTDHGRGTKNWTEHGPFISSSKQTWFMQLGNKVEPNGEMKIEAQWVASDFAETLAKYLGFSFQKEF
jgi:arylsulfatase A-like enzyme